MATVALFYQLKPTVSSVAVLNLIMVQNRKQAKKDTITTIVCVILESKLLHLLLDH